MRSSLIGPLFGNIMEAHQPEGARVAGHEYGIIGEQGPKQISSDARVYHRGNIFLRSVRRQPAYSSPEPFWDDVIGEGSVVKYDPLDTDTLSDGTRLVFVQCVGSPSSSLGYQGYIPAHMIRKPTVHDPVRIFEASGYGSSKAMKVRFVSSADGALVARKWRSGDSGSLDVRETSGGYGEEVVEVYLVK